jgi:hypothetical protein
LTIQCLALSRPSCSTTKKNKDFDSRTKTLYTATGRNSHNDDGIDDGSVQKDSGLPGKVE